MINEVEDYLQKLRDTPVEKIMKDPKKSSVEVERIEKDIKEKQEKIERSKRRLIEIQHEIELDEKQIVDLKSKQEKILGHPYETPTKPKRGRKKKK